MSLVTVQQYVSRSTCCMYVRMLVHVHVCRTM